MIKPQPLTNPDHPTCVACRHRQTYGCPCKPTSCRLGAQPGEANCKPAPKRT
jgi:hypothetical protein